MPTLHSSGAPLAVTPGEAIALPDGGFLVLDRDWVQRGPTGAYEYDYTRTRFDALGERVGRPTLLGEQDDTFFVSSPRALADGSLVFVASEVLERASGVLSFTHRVMKQAADGSLVTLRIYRAEQPSGPDEAFNPARRTPDLDVAADGSLVITRSAGTDGAEERVLDVLEADGSARSLGVVVTRERRDAAFDTEESVALADGRSLVVWNDLVLTAPMGQGDPVPFIRSATFMGRFVGPDGQPDGQSFVIRADAFDQPSPWNPVSAEVIALPGGGFAVHTRTGFRSATGERTDERFVALHDATGARISPDQRYAAGGQLIPGDSTLASLGDGRVAAFWIVQTADGETLRPYTVHGQVFGSDGELSGTAFVVGRGQARYADLSEAIVLADGRLAVSWYEDGLAPFGDEDDRTIVQILDPRTEAMVFDGTAASDRVIGTGLDDTLSGGAGRDTLDGAGGADVLAGGAGNDTYGVDGASDRVTEAEGGGVDLVRASASIRLGAHLEDLLLTGSAAIAGTGNDGDNEIRGNEAANALNGAGGADRLHGASGDDTLDGGAGRDTLEGGRGNDTYVLGDRGDTVLEIAERGVDTIRSAFAHTLAAAFENLTLTGDAALVGTGNAAANGLVGNAGDNTLNGLAGDDTLEGGQGLDTLRGGSGDDTYVLRGRDVVVESAGGGRDAVHAFITCKLGARVENLMLLGTEAINGFGNDGANAITGNRAANLLSGGLGADTLIGGAGDDVYVVDEGDQIVENGWGGTDTIRSSSSASLFGLYEVERLELLGRASDGTGNFGANEIVGNAADNWLDGGGGRDTLTGGAGRDTFIFAHGAGRFNVVAITDFRVVNDTLKLSSWAFDGLGPFGSEFTPEMLALGSRAREADDRVIYNGATGALFYDQDGNGQAAAVQFAQLDPGLALAARDFEIA